MDLTKIAAAVRRRARSGTWSLGVKLARDGLVGVESQNAEEIVLRVRAPGRPVAPSAVLYPGELEWDCDCGSRVSPCEHVAAAVIALTHAEQAGADGAPPAPAAVEQKWGHVLYRFARAEGGLKLERSVVAGNGGERPLETSLVSLLANPSEAARLQVEEADLRTDRLLETRNRGVLPATKLEALLQVLLGCPRITLDGQPVTFGEETILPHAVIAERGADLVVTVARDRRVDEVLSPGVGLCGDAVHRLGELELTGVWLQNLPIVRVYEPRETATLVATVLPDLSGRMPVDIRTGRLPRVARDLAPRVVVDLEPLGMGLSAMPKLVYGSPPSVRIDDGKLVYLGGAVPVRDVPAERRLLESLREALGLLPGRRVTFQGPELAVFVGKLKRWRGDLAGSGASQIGANVRLEPRLRVAAAVGPAGAPGEIGFDLTFAVIGDPDGNAPGGRQTGERIADAASVIRAWQDGLGILALEGGGWAPLPAQWLDQHGARVADLLAAREADGRIATHAAPDLAELCRALDHPPPPGLDALAPLLDNLDRLPDAALPVDLTADLRPYQRDGVRWLAFLRKARLGGVLADDMGLGKTLQALCVLDESTRPALVACPTSVVPNWAAEIRRFRPSLRTCLYHGAGRTLDPEADVVLTSHALLRLDVDKLAAVRWGAAIVDEAQAIKNPENQLARAAFRIAAPYRLALSGTPVENRLDELWSLIHFTNRGLLGGRRAFDDRYARPIADGDRGAAERLRRRIRPFVLRRLKADVAPELPPRTDALMRVALSDHERAVYDAVRAASRAEVVALFAKGGSVIQALEALLRLRQAACHPALVPGQHAATSAKLEALVAALETAVADHHKALVFSQWTSLLDLIESPLREAALDFIRLDGSTKDRGEVVSRFQSDDGPPILLVSLKAGGTGLNLTAADHVFLCDPWWNPAVEQQAADRAHRIGQERPVFVNRLIAVGTVEERILELQDRKRALAEAALGEAEQAASLTRDDLLALFD